MTGTLIDLLVLLGVICIVCVAGWYVLSQMQLTEPVRKIVLIVFVIVVAVLACIVLLQLAGRGRLVAARDAPPVGASVPAPETQILKFNG